MLMKHPLSSPLFSIFFLFFLFFLQAVAFFPFIIVGPLFALIALYFLYIEIGPTAFLAVAMVIGQIPALVVFSRIFIKLRLFPEMHTLSQICQS